MEISLHIHILFKTWKTKAYFNSLLNDFLKYIFRVNDEFNL